MKNKMRNTVIMLFVLTVIMLFVLYTIFLSICFFSYQIWLSQTYTHDHYKWIDLRNEWPKGLWVQAKFVVVGMYKEETLIIDIPKNKLNDFQSLLKHEIENSPKMNNPQWTIYQLRIITTKGKYTTEARIAENKVFANSWTSYELKKHLSDYLEIEKNQ
jgi:hypothetical protein